MSKRGSPPKREAMHQQAGTPTRPSVEGGEFRWSWDEIKGVFSRPFSGDGSRGNSAPERAPRSGTSGISFLLSSDFRWSFDDIKDKIFRSSKSTSSGSNSLGRKHAQQQQQQRSVTTQESVPTVVEKPKRKRTRRSKLSAEEKAARKMQRMEYQRNKKITREKNRREKVHELFDQLGGILGIGRQNRKGERNPTSSKVAILSSAIARVKKKKGIQSTELEGPMRGSTGSYSMNDGLFIPKTAVKSQHYSGIEINESLLDAEDFLDMEL